MQFSFLKDDKEPERDESTTLILQLTMLKCSCLHIRKHHRAFFVYTDFCTENRLKLTLVLCTAVWNTVNFWFRRKDPHGNSRAWLGLFPQNLSCPPGTEAEGTVLQLPTEIHVPLEMAHTSSLIPLAQTNTATRAANPPTASAGTESEYLFKYKLFLRRPFMGLFSCLWPLGRKDVLKTSVTVCLQRWYHPCNERSTHTWLFAFTKCIRENNLFVYNSFKIEVSFTRRRVFHRNRVCTLWRFQKDLRNNIK